MTRYLWLVTSYGTTQEVGGDGCVGLRMEHLLSEVHGVLRLCIGWWSLCKGREVDRSFAGGPASHLVPEMAFCDWYCTNRSVQACTMGQTGRLTVSSSKHVAIMKTSWLSFPLPNPCLALCLPVPAMGIASYS
jgi:hypothetical protein